MERRLAAILSADMVGYSRLIRADEEGTITALKALRADLIDPKFAEHSGRIVKLMGDGMLVEFTSVVGAVRAATEIQQATAKRNVSLPDEKRIEFRVGINLGDVVIDGDDIQGDGVNIAARLEGIAEPGGICVSESVYDQVRDRLKLTFEDMGEREVKNIDRPVRAWRWIPDRQAPTNAADIDVSQPVPGFGGRAAIAVLPFDNLSSDPEQEYFADGIAEDILTSLQAFHTFPVIARNSTFTYKGAATDVRTVAKALGAGYVLEGSVRKVGGKVRITAQLVNAGGLHLWAGKYDRELSDIFAVQDEITAQIVAAIAPEIDRADMILAARKRPKDMTAWDYLLQAQDQHNKLTLEGVRQARELTDKALDREPKMARALVLLTRIHIANALFFSGLALSESPEESIQKAAECARKATEADRSLGAAHAALGMTFVFQKLPERGLQETSEAVRLNPSEPTIRSQHATLSWMCGDPDKGLEELQVAKRLSPNDSNMWSILHTEALILAMSGRHEEAIVVAEKAIDERAGAAPAHIALILSLDSLGRTEEAKSAFQRTTQMAPGFSPRSATIVLTDEVEVQRIEDVLRRAGWDG
jgi:adenylate cyclase